MEAIPQQPSSGTGNGPTPLDELQQTSFSLLNTWVLCAHHRPLGCAATGPNYFDAEASTLMFIPNHPYSNSSLVQGDGHKRALLNLSYINSWSPWPVLNTKWIREPSSQKAICFNGLCHSLPVEWITNSPFGICNLLNHGGFQVNREPNGRCCLAGGIQVAGPAAQIPLLNHSPDKNALFYFVLVTRKSQSAPFYRPGNLRQESHERTCLWPYIAV